MDTSCQLYSSSSSNPMGEASTNINTTTTTTATISTISTSISTNINLDMSIASSRNTRIRSKEMESLSFEISKYPRDLLQTFMMGKGGNESSSRRYRSEEDPTRDYDEGDDDDDEGLNLGLGLSLGGKFGVDKSKDKGLLIRSSSIAGTMPLFREEDKEVAEAAAKVVPLQSKTPVGGLVRSSSLPVETEEEWKKRKEMQTLRRMEAKRRRSEKQRSFKDAGGGSGGGGGEEKGVEAGLKLRARLEREQQCLGLTSKFIGSSMGNLFGSTKPPPPTSSNNVEVKGKRTTFGSLQGFLMAQAQAQPQPQLQPQPQPQPQPQQGFSQASGESQGGTCSSSELESKAHQGSSSCGEARSPPSAHSQQERGSQESMGSLGPKDDPSPRASGPEAESSSKQPATADKKRRETGSSGIEDMPCVFTIGDGPNGRKVEGILYKYGKGEEVRIMCVCHGNFFSPSEFVKHAGGRDVDHPLRHIVVSPSTSPFQ